MTTILLITGIVFLFLAPPIGLVVLVIALIASALGRC